MDEKAFLQGLVDRAAALAQEGGQPIAAAVVDDDGQVLGFGANRVKEDRDPTAHAEVEALRAAGSALAETPPGTRLTVYTTHEPCLMCLGAILTSGIDRVVWVAGSRQGSATALLEREGYLQREGKTLELCGEPFSDLTEKVRSLKPA